jgi:hypothetical protein
VVVLPVPVEAAAVEAAAVVQLLVRLRHNIIIAQETLGAQIPLHKRLKYIISSKSSRVNSSEFRVVAVAWYGW